MQSLLPAHLATFMAGVFLADIYADGHLGRVPKSRVWDIVAVGALLVGFVVPRDSGLGKLAMALSFAIFVASGFKVGWLSRILSDRWVSSIGGMCYSIYLIHMPLLYVLGKGSTFALFHGPFWLNFVVQGLILVPLIILPSAVFFVFIERPFMTSRH
jgi:peptidoglycan/LPS O-acetylase OafA/YrhL